MFEPKTAFFQLKLQFFSITIKIFIKNDHHPQVVIDRTKFHLYTPSSVKGDKPTYASIRNFVCLPFT